MTDELHFHHKNDFKPSAVKLNRSFPPLVGVFGKVEAEIAAAVIVRALAADGDEWKTIDLGLVSSTLKKAVKDGVEPFASMSSNPFCKPDIHELVRLGFAVWVTDEHVRFTDEGIRELELYSEREAPP